MYRGLFADRLGHVIISQAEEPALGDGEVRIRSALGSIKHGTQFHILAGESPFHDRRFDREKRLFVPLAGNEATQEGTGQFIGNMVAGEVVEVGRTVRSLRRGDRVYCHGPLCELLTVPDGDVRRIRPPMSDAEAVCMDPALMALAALRDARACLGDTVAIFGLGAIGLFLVQMARACGCHTVVAVDPVARRRRLAEGFGADLALDPGAGDAALLLRDRLTKGADIAIEASGHYGALRDAIRSVRNCGRVVTLGFYRGKDTGLELGAEWLHNRLEMICTMPDWDNPSREFPVWDRERLHATVEELFCRRALSAEGILDPVTGLDDAAGVFMRAFHDASAAVKMAVRFG